jgi:hypothetical protein
METEELTLEKENGALTEEGEASSQERVKEVIESCRQDLRAEYDARVGPLRQEKESLEKEKFNFLFSSRREIEQTEAKIGLTDGDILKLKADGKFEKADEKKEERSQLEAQLQTLKEQQTSKIEELSRRISEIEGQMVKEAETTKNILLKDFEDEARRLLLAYFIYVEAAWGALSGFAMTTKCGLSQILDRKRLAIHPSGSDANKLLYKHLKEWIY